MAESAPSTVVTLSWVEGQQFTASHKGLSWTIDGRNEAGPSPVLALAAAVSGCMGIDIVHILTRGRHEVRALEASFSGERAATEPKRFTRIDLQFSVTTSAPPSAVERAIELSHEKYCSVWHSMRQDIEFRTGVAITPIAE